MQRAGEAWEQQIPVEWLGGLSVVLARVLGEAGVGGADLERLIGESVRAECVSCGLGLSGADLIMAGLGDEVPERLARLRLGYCARRDCRSRFYVVRFLPREGTEWRAIWGRSETCLRGVGARGGAKSKGLLGWLRGVVSEEAVGWITRTRALGTLGAVVLVLVGFAGCRLHSVLNKPRTFIVSEFGVAEGWQERGK